MSTLKDTDVVNERMVEGCVGVGGFSVNYTNGTSDFMRYDKLPVH